jgi:hypothetical protein
LSQGEIVANSLADYLQRHSEIERKISLGASHHFYTTDSTEDFDKHAANFYGAEIRSVHVDSGGSKTLMLRELGSKRVSFDKLWINLQPSINQGTKAGPIKILSLPAKILNPKSKICTSTPTFAVLSQTVESGVSAGELNTPFLHGHF